MRRPTLSLRLLPSLMEEARKAAASEGVSLNQLINVAVAEKVSALRTEIYLHERIRRADHEETLRILDRAVKGKPPLGGDGLLIGGLQVEPAPVIGGLQVEPAPVIGGLPLQGKQAAPAPVIGGPPTSPETLSVKAQPGPLPGGLPLQDKQVQPAPLSGGLPLQDKQVQPAPVPDGERAGETIKVFGRANPQFGQLKRFLDKAARY